VFGKASARWDRNFLLFLTPTLLQGVAGMFIMMPVTTYYLDPADIGVVAILTALAMPIVPLASTGDSWVLSTHWHQTLGEGRRDLLFNLLLANISMKVFWVAVFWFLSPVLLPVLVRDYRPEYQAYFGLALIGLLTGTSWITLSSLMVNERAPVSHAVNESLQWGTGAATTLVGLSVMKLGVVAMFLAPIAGGIASTIHGWYYIRRKISGRVRAHWLREIVQTGVPAIPFSVTDVAGNTLDRFVIQHWLNLTSLGIYAHAQTYRGIFINVTKAYSRTMIPNFLELFATGSPRLAQALESTASAWYLCITVGGILVTLFSPELVHVLTHGKFDAAAKLVPLWYLFVFAHSMGVPFTQYLLSVRRNGLMSASSILLSIVTMALVIAGTWKFGVVGATLAAAGGATGLHLARYILARRLGCPYELESGFVWGVGALFATYAVVHGIGLPLGIKVVAAVSIIGVALIRLARLAAVRDIVRVA
jgi:O-antigen/teichoic acid export membrane protein